MSSSVKESNYIDNSSQTDEDLIYNYAWTSLTYLNISKIINHIICYYNKEFYHHFNKHSSNQSNINLTSQFYDYKNGLYFDAKNALYFEQSENLYFDKENKRYYHYILNEQTKSYHLRYHSKISKKKWKILKEKLDDKKENSKEDIVLIESDSSTSDRYIANEKSSIENTIKQKLSELNIKTPNLKNEVIEIDSDMEDGQLNDITTQYPPCIRAILMDSTDYDDELICTNKKGTLFIIPFTGGSVGKNSSKNIIDLINEDEVDNLHALVEYDLKKKSYYIEDKNSKHGTFLNKEKLEPNKKYELKHNDELEIGKSVKLLIHIHNGSITCVKCEPGEVMQKFKMEKVANKQPTNHKSIEESRREISKSIKNKYGIKWNEDSFDHVDRSKIRRKKVGIDVSHIDIDDQISPSSVNKPLDKSNLGLKLLKNMGWKEGQGLGKKEDGIKEPIKMVIRPTTSGFGYNEAKLSLDASEGEKRKLISWNKTKTRFNLIDKQSQKNLSNVFNVDDDDED